MAKLRRIGLPAPSGAPKWFAEFDSAIAKSGLARLTVLAYRSAAVLFLRWLERTEQSLQNLSPSDLLAYRQHLVNVEGRKAATVNQRLQALRWLCRWAQRRGLIATNPASEVKTIRIAIRRRPLGLSESEVHKLLRAAGQGRPSQRMRNYAVLQLLLQAGLRVSEVTRLRVADATVHERSGHVLVREGKGAREREIPLNISVRRAIRAYISSQPGVSREGPLFVSQKGRALSERSIEALVANLARQGKLGRRVTPHMLRHTFALTYLKDNPGKLVELASLMGHESLDTTAIYTQASSEELAADLEKSRLNVFG
jgi:site-specific recombinase XerD